jgi:molecular chaperone HtpG
MTEQVLRENFWKAGSSGKRSQAARDAGVVGTFGIGAMANFGVCTRLTVETRTEGSEELLRSVADRSALKIAEECISFERTPTNRGVGTTITAVLDPMTPITVKQAKAYLRSYVGMLPVPVMLNGELISQGSMKDFLPIGGRSFEKCGTLPMKGNLYSANCDVRADSNGQVLVVLTAIRQGGTAVEGSMAVLQNGGQLMGLRSHFGLAPIPALGTYQFGGFANLAFLKPTAGREALSRESIEQVTRLINMAELAASMQLATTDFADKNTAFQQWLVANNRWDLGGRLLIGHLPAQDTIRLDEVKTLIGDKRAQYYAGTDRHIIATFANEGSHLFQVAQGQPRKNIQLHYLRKLGVSEVPDSVRVTRTYDPQELTLAEASVALRIASILRDDYLIPDVNVVFVEMSHGVTVLPVKVDEQLTIKLARSGPLLAPLLEFRETAFEVFGQFMKDFVRVHIYHRVQQFVPSSTKVGVDNLRKLLERNRELYRYEETDRGDLEGLLGDLLSGTTSFSEVLKTVRTGGGWAQSQRVSSHQVGSIESVVPSVVDSPVVQPAQEEGGEFEAVPPILREDISSDMKILTTDQSYPQLNGFTTLLGLSDRLMRTEATFFRTPHTTRIIWGGHRVIYIFTEATGRLSLYYDIELRDPIEQTMAGGGLFRSTTLFTNKRIFVPVPQELAEQFRVSSGSREFFVRFDLLQSDA